MTETDQEPTEPATAPARSARGRPATSPEDRRDRIAAIEQAVVTCLGAKSAADLSIDDIAHAAGMSRRTFYRFFDTRRALFAHVLQRHAVAIGEAVRGFTAGQPNFAAAIVEGTMETLRLIKADIVFAALADADNKLLLDVMKVDVDASDAPLFFATWADVVERGRAAGQLRPSISNEQAAHWLRNMHYLLSLRPDLDDAGKRALLVDFALPALTLAEPGAPPLHGSRKDSSTP